MYMCVYEEICHHPVGWRRAFLFVHVTNERKYWGHLWLPHCSGDRTSKILVWLCRGACTVSPKTRLGPHGAHAFCVYSPLSLLGVGVHLVFWQGFFFIMIIVHCFHWAFLSFFFFFLITNKCHTLVYPVTRPLVTVKTEQTKVLYIEIEAKKGLLLFKEKSLPKWAKKKQHVCKKRLLSKQSTLNARSVTHKGCERPQSFAWLLGWGIETKAFLSFAVIILSLQCWLSLHHFDQKSRVALSKTKTRPSKNGP